MIMLDPPALSDDELLDRLQRAAFGYFLSAYNPANGLVADTCRAGRPAASRPSASRCPSYPVAVERGWMTRDEAVERTLVTLRFFSNSPQSEAPDATGYKGLYYHFLDMQTGRRVWRSELSLIDTALLIAGVLTASTYFADSNQSETEIRESPTHYIAASIGVGRRTAKRLFRKDGNRNAGFSTMAGKAITRRAFCMYLLWPRRPIRYLNSYQAWTSTYQWENLYGYDFLYAGPLFIHQFSHAWIDFRGIQDPFMREKRSDYFENSRQATYIQREYALRNPHGFRGYGENCWGLSAGDGPGSQRSE